jgi:hypothetical protein
MNKFQLFKLLKAARFFPKYAPGVAQFYHKMNEWDDLINENTYDNFIRNTNYNKNKIIIKKGLSVDILPTLEQIYDFIYIDGDHQKRQFG